MTKTERVPSFATRLFSQFSWMGVAVGFLLALALGSICRGQEPKKLPTPPTTSVTTSAVPEGAHELTATDLEAFLDGLMPAQLERENIAGAVVAVVKDGKVVSSIESLTASAGEINPRFEETTPEQFKAKLKSLNLSTQ